jgi:hypothetical protein
MMRPIETRDSYLTLRGSAKQQAIVKAVRMGDTSQKMLLLQMNYSCLPNEDGSLKGSTRMSTTIGMDIDHINADELQAVRERILGKKEELGLLMLELSARGAGYHLVFRRRAELSQEDNLRWASQLLGVAYDEGAKDITRVFFSTTGSEEDLLYLDDEIFEVAEAKANTENLLNTNRTNDTNSLPSAEEGSLREKSEENLKENPAKSSSFSNDYHGIPFTEIIAKYWELFNDGKEPQEGDRDTLTYQLACDLRHICGRNAEWLDQVIPCYDGFPLEEKRQKIRNALASKYEGLPQRMRDTLNALQPNREAETLSGDEDGLDEGSTHEQTGLLAMRLPLGVRDSVDAAGPPMAMPVLTAICPCIGALATGVVLDVHGQKRGLNIISYIAGDFASGKGLIDPVIEAWMREVATLDAMYVKQEEAFRAKKLAAKNKKEQPEEPKLPVRFVTLNTTVAKLADRLANTCGKHAYSFTPEADTVAQKWRSEMSDFSVMLRQSYDGSKYEREAKSVDAVNVHIEHLLWNVTMCGTPDALYRVVKNYTDGLQSHIAVASTTDNTFAPLEDKPHVLTDRQSENIRQVAHLLPLMQGEVVLPKLEARGRAWLEKIRLETIKNDDRVKARQRIRVCVTAQRMTCCLMLCRVAEELIQKHGLNEAEQQLKQHPALWRELLLKTQTPKMLKAYDIIADALLENALRFFRERIENAFRSSDYAGNNERRRRGKNDTIFERLDVTFTFSQVFQQSVAIKGSVTTRNSVYQMLKNWKRQGLVEQTEPEQYRKLS